MNPYGPNFLGKCGLSSYFSNSDMFHTVFSNKHCTYITSRFNLLSADVVVEPCIKSQKNMYTVPTFLHGERLRRGPKGTSSTYRGI